MRDDEFEWDDAKAAANLARHDVSFETARRAFDDPYAILRNDFRDNYGEERFTLIGMVGDQVLYVAHTWRAGRIRLISARKAEPYERRLYHEENR